MIGLLFFAILTLANVASASPLSVPLIVENRDWQDLEYLRGLRTPRNAMPPLMTARSREPVTTGVPLPRDWNVLSVNQLEVAGPRGYGIPTQFRVLARHDAALDTLTAPIKVVLVHFQTDVPSGGASQYTLRVVTRPAVARPALATEDAAAVRIDTGLIRVGVRKDAKFSVFSQVNVATRNGRVQVVAPGSAGGLHVRSRGALFTSGVPTAISVEENGPLKAVVRVEGILADKTPLLPDRGPIGAATRPIGYTAWLTFFRGKTYVKVAVRLENENRGWGYDTALPQVIWLDSVELVLPLALTGTPTVAMPGWSGVTSDATLEHRWENVTAKDEAANFSYRTLNLEQEVSRTVGRSIGWLAVSAGKKGVTVVRRFSWQEHPSTLRMADGMLRVGLLPAGLCNDECRDGAYRFWGGYHKTFEMVYNFTGDRAPSPAALGALLATATSPLTATSPPDWYAKSGVFGSLAPFGMTSTVAVEDNALRGRERWARVKYDRTLDDGAIKDSLHTYRERRPYWPSYGWERFGEMYAVRGATSQDYGWSGLLLRSFLESGDLEFLSLGLEHAAHHADIDVVHDRYTPPTQGYLDAWQQGAQRYENDAHSQSSASSQTGALSGTSHSWSDGEMIAYFLTGESRFRESVGAQAEHARRGQLLCNKRMTAETRQQGWAIQLLLNEYRISGRSAWLDDAMRIFREGLLVREQDAPAGFTGYTSQLTWPAPAGVAIAHLLYDLVAARSLIELHGSLVTSGRAIDAQDVQAFLVRMATFLRDKVVASYKTVPGSTTTEGAYSPFAIPYIWRSDQPTSSMHPPHGLWAADVLAFAFTASADATWLALARNVWTDSMNYYSHIGWFQPYGKPQARITRPLVWMSPHDTWAKTYAFPVDGRYYLYTENQKERP